MFIGGADEDNGTGMLLLGLLIGILVVLAWNCYSGDTTSMMEGMMHNVGPLSAKARGVDLTPVAANRLGINEPSPTALGNAIQQRERRAVNFAAQAQPTTPSTFTEGLASYTPHDYDRSPWLRAQNAFSPKRWIDWRTSDIRDDEFDKYLGTTSDPFNYGSVEGMKGNTVFSEANPWSGPEKVAKWQPPLRANEGYADARGTSASYDDRMTEKEMVQQRMKKVMNTCPEKKLKHPAGPASGMGM